MTTLIKGLCHDSPRCAHVAHLEVPPEADCDEEYVDALKAVDHVEDPFPGGERSVLGNEEKTHLPVKMIEMK